jgi:hypothetical protein
MDDVYKMLNYIFDKDFMAHELIGALNALHEINPIWFETGVSLVNGIKLNNGTDDFEALMKYIDERFADFEIELEKVNPKIDSHSDSMEIKYWLN